MTTNDIRDVGHLCSGCRACVALCPVSAIRMEPDGEGFLRPVIEEKMCLECGLCKRNCPMLTTDQRTAPRAGYAATAKDRAALTRSASGGFFSSVAKRFLETYPNARVFGCAYDEAHMPRHIAISRVEDIPLLCGSKYVQSNMEGVYREVSNCLLGGEKVLFSGTPCQVAGLYAALGGKQDGLLCLDLICHGVPSRRLFGEYLAYLEKNHKGSLTSYSFRSKRRHGWSLTLRAEFKGKRHAVEKIASLDPYYYSYLQGDTYRESCYDCPFACLERVGDITMGDFWGVEHVLPAAYRAEGVSAILVNTEKGEELFDLCKQDFTVHEVSPLLIQSQNGNLAAPTKRRPLRDSIYRELDAYGFAFVARTYMRHPRHRTEAVRNLIPNAGRQRVKRLLKRAKRILRR